MSQLERQKEEKKRTNGNAGPIPQKKFQNVYTSYNPTREEKQAIMEMVVELDEVLDFFSTYLQDGFSLTWKYKEEHECYIISIKENTGDWTRDRHFTCWHVDWLKGLKMLYHGLSNRYREWPNQINGDLGPDIEW